jgi:hypothetical protein
MSAAERPDGLLPPDGQYANLHQRDVELRWRKA